MSPKQAKTYRQICQIPRDNVDGDDFWAIIDVGKITIARQKIHENPTQEITLTRAEFEAVAHWYETGEWEKPRRKK